MFIFLETWVKGRQFSSSTHFSSNFHPFRSFDPLPMPSLFLPSLKLEGTFCFVAFHKRPFYSSAWLVCTTNWSKKISPSYALDSLPRSWFMLLDLRVSKRSMFALLFLENPRRRFLLSRSGARNNEDVEIVQMRNEYLWIWRRVGSNVSDCDCYMYTRG